MVWTGDRNARLARSLLVLLAEVDAAWPTRDRRADGTIGDAAHQARHSDHNPDANGVVRAVDITTSGTVGRSVAERARSLGKSGAFPPMGSGSYVIFAAQIADDIEGWRWRPYSGPSKHYDHVHISVSTAESGYDSQAPWGFGASPAAPEDDLTPDQAQTLDDTHAQVAALRKEMTGRYGADTDRFAYLAGRLGALMSSDTRLERVIAQVAATVGTADPAKFAAQAAAELAKGVNLDVSVTPKP